MDTTDSAVLGRRASRITVAAHCFGILAVILVLVWLLHYREGIDLDSDNPNRIFNVHPFLMLFGFIFLSGEGMMVYKTLVPAGRGVRKFVHMLINLVAICVGIVGLLAVFKFHDRQNIPDMYSLHSWIGMATFCFFAFQWLVGFVVFMFPKSSASTRASALPWHVSGGRALFYMAICAAETGLMEKVTFLELKHDSESCLINFIGIAILLFGLSVDLSIALAR